MSRTPLAVIPGTGVGSVGASVAYRHWLEHKDRLFPLPGKGLNDLDATYSVIEPTLVEWATERGGRIAIAGHSQGAYHAVRFGLQNPHLVSAVVGVGGPFDGAIRSPFPSAVNRLIRVVVPVAMDFKSDSRRLKSLEEQVRDSWPDEVNLTLVAGHRDLLVRPRRSAHGLHGNIRKVYIGPHRPKGLPEDIEHIHAPLAGHLSQIFMPAVVQLVRPDS